jgi:hypothetical protein
LPKKETRLPRHVLSVAEVAQIINAPAPELRSV